MKAPNLTLNRRIHPTVGSKSVSFSLFTCGREWKKVDDGCFESPHGDGSGEEWRALFRLFLSCDRGQRHPLCLAHFMLQGAKIIRKEKQAPRPLPPLLCPATCSCLSASVCVYEFMRRSCAHISSGLASSSATAECHQKSHRDFYSLMFEGWFQIRQSDPQPRPLDIVINIQSFCFHQFLDDDCWVITFC